MSNIGTVSGTVSGKVYVVEDSSDVIEQKIKDSHIMIQLTLVLECFVGEPELKKANFMIDKIVYFTDS